MEFRRKIVEDVVLQHFENASFGWESRDRLVHEPHVSLADLEERDSSLQGDLDGLQIAGQEGFELWKPLVDPESPGDVFVVGLTSRRLGSAERWEEALSHANNEEIARALVSAIGFLGKDEGTPLAEELLKSDSPLHRWIGVGGVAVLRLDRVDLLKPNLSSMDPMVKARAFRAAGELGKTTLAEDLRIGLKDADPVCQFWAAWSLTVLGQNDGLGKLQELAEGGGENAEWAADLFTRRLTPEDAIAYHRRLSKDEKKQRLAARIAGAAGDAGMVPWLIELTKNPEHARVAGEALSFITGVDIAYEDLDGEQPEGFEAGPTDDPDDENVELDPDENLPWPDPKSIEAWWQKIGRRYPTGKKIFMGQPFGDKSLGHVLKTGKQRQRAVAALELKLQNPRPPLFEVRARGDLQRELLGK